MDAQEAKITMAIALATLIISLLLIGLILLIYFQQKSNWKLQRKVSIGEIASLEFERARIAADIHDDVGPLVAAIKIKLSLLTPSGPIDQESISHTLEYLDDTLGRLRKISNNLLPTVLEQKGLKHAIHELTTQMKQFSNLFIEYEFNDIPLLSKEYQVHIYRIIKEAVFNCIKHAKATKLKITFVSKSNFIKLYIVDNGNGIPSAVLLNSSNGRGLKSLTDRVHIMGGELHIHSDPGKGTILEFQIPLHE